MKHIFLVNPAAGKSDTTDDLRRQLAAFDGQLDYEIYVTAARGDATRYVDGRCAAEPNSQLRFYACGGDGTLNEVVSGAVGHANVEVACYPCGSGNDYIKYYGIASDFRDLDSLVHGTAQDVDVMQVTQLQADGEPAAPRYSLNICNFGFDAVVCKIMETVRRRPLIGGRNAYTTGILGAIFTARRTRCRISVDGSTVKEGNILLCTLGNGRFVGGAYQCSPLSLNNDGLIEVTCFKPMSLARFAALIGSYHKGSFMDKALVQKKMTYLRGQTIEIVSPAPIDLCVDGELLRGSSFRVEQLPRALRFVVPQGLGHNGAALRS